MDTKSTPKVLLIVVVIGILLFVAVSGNSPWNRQSSAQSPAPDLVMPLELPPEDQPEPEAPPQKMVKYIEVIDSCGPHFEGPCLHVRSGPGTGFDVTAELRTGIVLKVADTVVDAEGRTWYKISFGEWIRYPERISGDWFVAGDFVREFSVLNEHDAYQQEKTDGKIPGRIVVDLSEQMLYAYDGDTLFLQTPISTGVELTPTSVGTFHIFRKTPSRYMEGPIPGITDQTYDLPGVPWDMYFTEEGGAIHGTYWHNDFGTPHSHGCVNVPLDVARKLYEWAEIGTTVEIRE